MLGRSCIGARLAAGLLWRRAKTLFGAVAAPGPIDAARANQDAAASSFSHSAMT